MHLSEGVLHTPVLLGGAAVALVCVMIGLKRLNSQQLPLTALFAAAFFVAGTIHVPVGIGSVHLILNGYLQKDLKMTIPVALKLLPVLVLA